MKHLFALAFTAVLLIACSKETSETTVDPDLHPILLNTGNLFSVDGSKLHIAYTYDDLGRVIYAEHSDSTWWSWYMGRKLAEYRYDGDRIYITYQEFEELPNGEHQKVQGSTDIIRDDTLFLVDGRVDSCAGAIRYQKSSFHIKFRYNERGEMTSIKNENVLHYPRQKQSDKPWWSEYITLEWQDGNVIQKTSIQPNTRDTTVWTYHYSPLTGSFPLCDPRVYLYDFEPLFYTGYFGAACKNLPEGYKTKYVVEQIEYQLDEQQMVRQMKSDITSDEKDWHYDYHIKWVTPSTLR